MSEIKLTTNQHGGVIFADDDSVRAASDVFVEIVKSARKTRNELIAFQDRDEPRPELDFVIFNESIGEDVDIEVEFNGETHESSASPIFAGHARNLYVAALCNYLQVYGANDVTAEGLPAGEFQETDLWFDSIPVGAYRARTGKTVHKLFKEVHDRKVG